MRRDRPLIIAHRGGSPRDIDNSREAFVHALAVGVDMLECDLRRTRDGALVLLHDEAIRSDGRRLVVADTSYVDLKRALPWLLTLAEFLAEFGGALPFNLDLKTHGYELAALAEIERHGLTERVIFSTGHTLSLRRLAAARPGLRLGLSRGHLNSHRSLRWLTFWLQWLLPRLLPLMLRAADATAAMLQYRVVDRALVERLHRFGYEVFSWTVDTPAEAFRLTDAGVDGIATNVPARLLAAFAEREEHQRVLGIDKDGTLVRTDPSTSSG